MLLICNKNVCSPGQTWLNAWIVTSFFVYEVGHRVNSIMTSLTARFELVLETNFATDAKYLVIFDVSALFTFCNLII